MRLRETRSICYSVAFIGLLLATRATAAESATRATATSGASDLVKHVPHFVWKTNDKGEKCILDGDSPVAVLYQGPGSVCFHDWRLVPNGPIFMKRGHISSGGISWRNTNRFKMTVDEIAVDDQDPQCLKLHFRMHDIGLKNQKDPEGANWQQAFEQEARVEVTYDPRRISYVFDFRLRLQIQPGREEAVAKHVHSLSQLEYFDVIPDLCHSRFPPHGNKRYKWFIYTGADGKLYKLPHTHTTGPEKRLPPLSKDAILAYGVESEYNPVVEMVGETGAKTFVNICFWAWDVHFSLRRDKDDKTYFSTDPKEVRYRVYSVPEAEIRRMLSEAAVSPLLQGPGARVPAYVLDGVNRFEPSEESLAPSDLWFWTRRTYGDPDCTWDWQNGYESKGCLAISRSSESGSSAWAFDALGHSYPPHPPLKGRYRIRAMVRMKDVTGYVRLRWIFSGGGKTNVEYSTKLFGANDWTEVVLETSAADSAVIAQLDLVQTGTGQSWFDDVTVESIPEGRKQ